MQQIKRPQINSVEEWSRAPTIYGIGRNYPDHASELGNQVPVAPIVFLKACSSIRSLDDSPMAFNDESYHHEVELVVRVAKSMRMGDPAGADVISHIGLGLDLTRRDAQSELKAKGLPWTLAKSFKGATVLGPLVDATGIDLGDLHFELWINGTRRQVGHTADMVFTVQKQLDYLLSFNDLNAGDLIFTGTPQGVGPMRVGDRFEMRIPAQDYCATGLL